MRDRGCDGDAVNGRRPVALWRASTPFETLVLHFVKRILASEEDQGLGAVNLGLGAVLALLAAPGGFASIFLLDKYSTLLQWVRGQTNFNAVRASVADEYFFVMLSMTIIGLVMVLRWNRLLPDSRDFANLAIMPIPIRNVFLANFIALASLAVLFGLDVNAASSLLFPGIVTASDVRLLLFVRVAAAHVAAVCSASLFSFFAVFALVGILMLVTPRAWFRPVSIAVRILLAILLLSEFLGNLFLQLFVGRLPHLRELYLKWLPSYWYLGVYEQVLGISNTTMTALAKEGMLALAAAVLISIAAYALCYRRHFLRLAESLQLVGFARHSFRLPLPEGIEKIFFRSAFERACQGFMLKVLFRSEKHLLFVGAYFGLGGVLAAQMASGSMTAAHQTGLPSAEWLAVPLMLAFIAVTGLRFAFDLPAAFEANWVFRIASGIPQPSPAGLARRFLWFAVVPAEIAIAGGITAHFFGSKIAIEHLAILVTLTAVLIESMLLNFQKIPFTCQTQLESRRILIKILGPVFGLLLIAPMLADFEAWILLAPARFTLLAIFAGIAFYFFWRSGRGVVSELRFEEKSPAEFDLLRLN